MVEVKAPRTIPLPFAAVYGDLYAPLGSINCVSKNIQYGWWLGRAVNIARNNFELAGIAGQMNGQVKLKLVE